MAPVVSDWNVDEVLAMLEGLGLGHLQEPFKENGVNGKLLVTLQQDEFVEDLGLKRLQAKNIIVHLKSLGAYTEDAAEGGKMQAVAPAKATAAARSFEPTKDLEADAAAAVAASAAAAAASTAAAADAAAKAAAELAASESAAAAAAQAAADNALMQAHMQAGNLLRESLGDLQTAEAILAKDKNLTGGMVAANVIAPRMGRNVGGPRGRQNAALVTRGATAVVSVGQQRSSEVADQAVQRAGQRIIQAKQLAPDIPQIDLAIVRSMQGGVYMNLLSGTLSQLMIRSKLQQSLNSLRTMISQVRGAVDWLSRPGRSPGAAFVQQPQVVVAAPAPVPVHMTPMYAPVPAGQVTYMQPTLQPYQQGGLVAPGHGYQRL